MICVTLCAEAILKRQRDMAGFMNYDQLPERNFTPVRGK
jgi:hypothetical protein